MKARTPNFYGRLSGYRSLSRTILVTLGQYLQGKNWKVKKTLNFVENAGLRFFSRSRQTIIARNDLTAHIP